MKRRKLAPPSTPSTRAITIDSLPDDVLSEIFKHFSHIELLDIQLVNKRFCSIATPLFWHSIYVYDPSDDIRAGRCWFNYTWMSIDKFLDLARARELKTRFMKRLVFYSDAYITIE